MSMLTEERVGIGVQLLRTMTLIRAVEHRIEELHRQGHLTGSFHSSIGQEASAAGVCLALQSADVVTSTHRGHGHAIAKGVSVQGIFAELFGAGGGVSGGRGGSMHLHDRSSGFLGTSAIVGGAMSWVAGAAWARRKQGLDSIGVGFIGDGAFGQGAFHESIRLALLWESPTLFVCENNGFAHSMPVERTVGRSGAIAEFARAEGMRAEVVDGRDAVGVYSTASELVDFVREGRPAFLECEVYRVKPHSLSDPDYRYRSRGAGQAWLADNDPLVRLRDEFAPDHWSELAAIDEEVESAVEAAVLAAQHAGAPSWKPRQLYTTPGLDDLD